MHKRTALGFILLLSACAVGPDYQRPSQDLPEQWHGVATDKRTSVQPDWWMTFNDPVLNRMEEEGLKANADLLVAAARVAEARAMLSYREADLYPALGVEGEAARVSNSHEGVAASGIRSSSKPFNSFSLAAVLDYEVDLWGRLRRASESAKAQLLVGEYNRDAIRLAVASDIATGYFNLLALDSQIAVTQDTITARKAAFDYQKAQYTQGEINELVFRQAESELAASRADLPSLIQAKAEQETALAVLLGHSPKSIVENAVSRGTALSGLPIPPALPTEAPSTLLMRRPDIQAAEQSLVSANADIGNARAEYFPTLSLSALLGLESSEADSLLQSSARKWQAGAGLAGPIVDFGRVRANVRGSEARKEQALIAYQQAVRVAFKEVVDAMSKIHTAEEQLAAQDARTEALAATLRVANARYDAGYSNYLEVLDAERALYQSRLAQVIAKRERLTAAISLYKALGGGWNLKQ